jgi:hypothetical protein
VHVTDAPFVDTSAADLIHELGLDDLPALATLTAGAAELRVLGASHQVRVGDWTETVACLTGRAGSLPGAAAAPGYTFTSKVGTHSRAGMRARVLGIKARVQRHRHGLAVVFQGDTLALTAMTAASKGSCIEWTTWHVYPQHGQIVHTQSRLDLPTLAAAA